MSFIRPFSIWGFRILLRLQNAFHNASPLPSLVGKGLVQCGELRCWTTSAAEGNFVFQKGLKICYKNDVSLHLYEHLSATCHSLEGF